MCINWTFLQEGIINPVGWVSLKKSLVNTYAPKYYHFRKNRLRYNSIKSKHELFNNYSSSQIGSESIAHEVEGQMGYWLRAHEGERNNCLSKIQLVGQKHRDKTTLASKRRFSRHCFGFQSWHFLLLVGYNI